MDLKPNTPRRALEHVAYLCSYNAPKEHILAFVRHQLKAFKGTYRTEAADPRQTRHLVRVKEKILNTPGYWHAAVWQIAQDGIEACRKLELEEAAFKQRQAAVDKPERALFQFRGKDVAIVGEVQMGKGRVLRVPMGDLSRVENWGHSGMSELRIMIGSPFMERFHEAMREVDYIAP